MYPCFSYKGDGGVKVRVNFGSEPFKWSEPLSCWMLTNLKPAERDDGECWYLGTYLAYKAFESMLLILVMYPYLHS